MERGDDRVDERSDVDAPTRDPYAFRGGNGRRRPVHDRATANTRTADIDADEDRHCASR
jgi:hypothetical protein